MPEVPIEAFGRLLAEHHGWLAQRQRSLAEAFADLHRLADNTIDTGGGHPAEDVVTVLDGRERVLDAIRRLHRSATQELLELRPPWRLADEPKPRAIVHRVQPGPVLLRVADRRAALVAESAEAGVLVRSAGFATAMGQVFDLRWEKSARAGTHLTPARHQVLLLMASGMDDAAVAAATGRSIRTVRNHIAAIMTALGAGTRMAAGVEAARRGWLP